MYQVKIPITLGRALTSIVPLACLLTVIGAFLITPADISPLDLDSFAFVQYTTIYGLILMVSLVVATLIVDPKMTSEVRPGDKAVLLTSDDFDADIAVVIATPSGPQVRLNVNGVTVPHTHEQLVILSTDGVDVTDEFYNWDIITTVDHLRVDTYDVGGFALPPKWTVTVATIGLTKDELKL